MTRLEFDSIEFSFGERRLLNSVYMRCEPGKITGLLGRNGCGKSTLMKVVFGSLPTAQKSIRIDGESIGLDYLHKNLIAYLPQGNLIPPYLTIRKAYSLFNINIDSIVNFIPEAADMLDLKPNQLSGGYCRVFEILLILHSKARFCLLDEPFTGLSPIFIEKVKSLLCLLKTNKGIIISDHMHRHVTEIADTVYVLANGKTHLITSEEQLVFLGYLSPR